MTAVADNKKRVTIRTARPGERFDVQVSGEKIILTRLALAQPQAAKVRIERRDGFSVGVLEKPIDEQAISNALSDFP
jgi:phage FluMu protein gp41